MSHGYILKSHYFVLICSILISVPKTNLNPVEFSLNSADSVLLPNKCIVTLPEIYTVTCDCNKQCTTKGSAASSALQTQNFASALEKNVVPKFTNRLSWRLHKICKYKGFLWAKFSRIWTESRDIYGKVHIRKNLYIPIFLPSLTYFTD